MTRDPAVEVWRACIGGGSSRDCERGECNALAACVAEGESTSARLQRVEAELGSDLADARQERDDLRALVAVLAGPHDGECAWRGLAVKVMREQQYTRAQLDDLIAHRSAGGTS